MSRKIKIIGIAGLARSGKDTLADLFIKEGYFGISAGDMIRDYTAKRYAKDKNPIARINTTETSNWLRKTKGADFYVKESLDRYEEETQKGNTYKGLLLWSIRAAIEADYILGHDGKLIWVETSDQIRYERNQQYLRDGEPSLTFEEFLAQEATQWEPQPDIPEEIQMNVSYVKKMSNLKLVNNFDNKTEFNKVAKKVIESVG